jgi:presenilin-like A22 family membrane protease
MDQRSRAYAACGFIVVIFLLVQLGALALVEPFKSAGLQAVEDPQDPTNSLIYIGGILVATVLMLAAIRLDVEQLIRGLVVFAGAYLSWYVFGILLPPVVTVQGFNVLAVAAAVLLAIGLYAYPEWWVIDLAGIVMGASAGGLFGISFGILPALVLLVALAVYDAISVYGTEHMLTLASGVMELRLPVVLVVPATLDYSFRKDAEEVAQTAADGERDESGADRGAYFIGLGDAVMPSILVASAAFFLDTPRVLGVELAALTAIVGTIVGLLVLMRMVFAGRAHAGLPLLNGGAILGYLVGALAARIPLLEALGIAPYV